MKFFYRGIIDGAKLEKGILEAKDRAQAIEFLTKQNIQLLELKEVKKSFLQNFSTQKHKSNVIRLNDEEMCRFFEKLARLLNGGLMLSDALESIIRNTSNQREKILLENVLSELREGISFSKALNNFCNSFSNNMLCILDVGSVTGHLAQSVSDIVKILRKKIELKKRLIAGLSYPIFICFMAIGVIGLFLFYLMPRIDSMMQSLGGSLPISVRILLNISRFFSHYFIDVLLLGGIFAYFLNIFYKQERYKLLVDRFILKLPVVGSLVLLRLRVNITATLAGLLSNGIDISVALNLAGKSINNSYVKQQYWQAESEILGGGTIAKILQKFGIICGTASDILAVGERTGNLGESFVDVVTMYENQLDKFLKQLVAWSSTIALFIAFSLVAILALSIVSSVLNFSTSLAH